MFYPYNVLTIPVVLDVKVDTYEKGKGNSCKADA